MNRRVFLACAGALATPTLGGCVTDDAGDVATIVGDGTPVESETGTTGERTVGDDTATDADGNRTAPPPGTSIRLVDAALTLIEGGCGQQTDEATVAVDRQAHSIRVTGTIWGADTCKVPVLADTRYDAQADELRVVVTTRNRGTEGTPVCGQCITELDYRATLSFEGGVPGSVTVVHDHDRDDYVATATPG